MTSKDKLIKALSNWHDSDIDLLIQSVLNSKLQIPYSMGEGKVHDEFKELLNKINQN